MTPPCELLVQNGTEKRVVKLDRPVLEIGRSSSCDLVLPDDCVSRHHARIRLDAMGHWQVEDLGSRNGTQIAGRGIATQELLPGQTVRVGSYTLRLLAEAGDLDRTVVDGTTIVDRPGVEVVATPVNEPQSLGSHAVEALNELAESLGTLSQVEDVYPEFCRHVGGRLRGRAAVLRSEIGSSEASQTVQTLAQAGPDGQDLPDEEIRLSRKVRDAIASGQDAVRANVQGSGGAIELTVAPEVRDASVYAVVLRRTARAVDFLYLQGSRAAPELDTLSLLRAAARQTGLTYTNLASARALADRAALDREMEAARSIQRKLTPPERPEFPGVDIRLYYEPAARVGGDLLDVWPTPQGRLALAIGDVSGHGLDAALIMAQAHAALHSMLLFCEDLSQVARDLNRSLIERTPDDRFLTLLVGLYDSTTGHLEYVNAGHEAPIHIGADGQVLPAQVEHDALLGVVDQEYRSCCLDLAPGESIVAFTDGIPEARGPAGSMFERQGILDAIAAAGPVGPSERVDGILRALAEFRAAPCQADDVTVLCLSPQ